METRRFATGCGARPGLQHRILAAACSVEPARHIRATYEECGYSAAEINSGMNEDERARSWYVCTSYA